MKKAMPLTFLLFITSVILLIIGCSPTPASSTQLPVATPQSTNVTLEGVVNNTLQTIAEAERLAGFEVREPTYLPEGVSFDFATYQELPSPAVTLHFKIVHEQYGDMGAFFQIVEEPGGEAPPDTISCGEKLQGCEILQLGDQQVVYRLNAGGTEGLNWYARGFSYRLLRTAGEPNKVYKDELVKVVAGLQ